MQQPSKVTPHIFREYDIRGLADGELGPDAVRAIGRAYGTVLARHGGSRFILGRDIRPHSEAIMEAFAEGAAAAGLEVVDIGEVPTPVMYYGLFTMKVDGGVIVTASHNPVEFNGFKLCVGRDSLFGDQIRALRQLIEAGDLASGPGKRSREEGLLDRYLEEVAAAGDDLKGLELVMDAGNGMACLTAPRLFTSLGAKVTELFCEPDGTFPNHEADPTQEANLRDLMRELGEQPSAVVGLGYDGDADRIGVVDPDGTMVYGDRLLILLAREVLRQGPATILCDVKCSHLVAQDVERHGGTPVMWKTGHSLIKAKMKELGAALAGEMSGHMFFADRYYGYDDAVYASLRLVNILARSGQRVSELLADLPQLESTPEIRVGCPEERKVEVVEALKDSMRGRFETLALDGIRFSTATGWGLVRASNTQPVLVLRFESETREELDGLKGMVREELARQGLEPDF